MTVPLWFFKMCVFMGLRASLRGGRTNKSNTRFAYAREHARMGVSMMQVQSGNSRGHKHWPLTKTKNKTLKKAKTNSNELASVTARRRAEKEGREKKRSKTWKDGVVERQSKRKSGSGKNILKCKSGAFPSALSPVSPLSLLLCYLCLTFPSTFFFFLSLAFAPLPSLPSSSVYTLSNKDRWQ